MALSFCLGLSLALTGPAQARDAKGPRSDEPPKMVHTRFFSEPDEAEILYNGTHYLGLSGQDVVVDVSPMGSTVDLTFRKSGYEPRALTVKLEDLKAGRVPAQGSVLLRHSGWRGWLEDNAAGAGGFLLGAGILGMFARRHRKQTRELERREEILATVDRSDSLTAQRLGRYRLLNILGKGGMATVYKAVPEATMDPGEAVAVKVLRKEIAENDEFMGRFRQEAQVTNSLDHPHILRLLDWGTERSYVYLVVELIEGGDLRSRLTGSPLPLPEVWSALRPLCEAVGYAHSRGVVHRDLKPENFLVTTSGILKVADFGLARSEDHERLTATGVALGTPAYMAPEQIQGLEPGPSMDQYAIGVIAYELITGRLPISGGDPVQLIFKTLTEPPTPLSHYVTISERLEGVVLRMLEKRPEDRFASLAEATRALDEAIHA